MDGAFNTPTDDHGAEGVPAVGGDEDYVGDYEGYEVPHDPEVPFAGCVVAVEEALEPGEGCAFVEGPAAGDDEETGDGHGEVGSALEGVVLGFYVRMGPGFVREFGGKQADVVSDHGEGLRGVAWSGEKGFVSAAED